MIVITDQLIINADDITLIKGDYDVEENRESQFKLLKPSTWFLEPIVTTKTKYYFQVFYRKYGRERVFKYYTTSNKSIQMHMDRIALQLKVQLKVADQEALDKIFENAILEAK